MMFADIVDIVIEVNNVVLEVVGLRMNSGAGLGSRKILENGRQLGW